MPQFHVCNPTPTPASRWCAMRDISQPAHTPHTALHCTALHCTALYRAFLSSTAAGAGAAAAARVTTLPDLCLWLPSPSLRLNADGGPSFVTTRAAAASVPYIHFYTLLHSLNPHATVTRRGYKAARGCCSLTTPEINRRNPTRQFQTSLSSALNWASGRCPICHVTSIPSLFRLSLRRHGRDPLFPTTASSQSQPARVSSAYSLAPLASFLLLHPSLIWLVRTPIAILVAMNLDRG